jgi:hypothetical protein
MRESEVSLDNLFCLVILLKGAVNDRLNEDFNNKATFGQRFYHIYDDNSSVTFQQANLGKM